MKIKKILAMNWTEISQGFGVGVGFINFYVLYHSWHISWGISFAIAFGLGYLASIFLEDYIGDKFDKSNAEKLSAAVEEFEEK
jgi:hypothetical protein